MSRKHVVLGCTGLLAVWGVVSQAQSLAEIAKREKERRAKLSKPATKAYNDDDLRARSPRADAEDSTEPTGSPEPTRSAQQPGSGTGGRAAASPPSGTGSARGRGEAYWRSRSRQARAILTAAERRVAEIETKAARQGPVVPGPLPAACTEGISVRRGGVVDLKGPRGKVCDPEVLRAQGTQRTQAELERARADLEGAKKALEALREEARRDGALPGWLR